MHGRWSVWSAAGVLALGAVLSLVLYVGAYCALVRRRPGFAKTMVGHPEYRIWDGGCQRLFCPVHRVDRWVRRDEWEFRWEDEDPRPSRSLKRSIRASASNRTIDEFGDQVRWPSAPIGEAKGTDELLPQYVDPAEPRPAAGHNDFEDGPGKGAPNFP